MRIDIFAFGLVFYEMLTGKRAFEGASQASLITSILKEQPRPVHELVPAGGVATVVTTVDPSRGETFHTLPSFLADGRHFL